MPSLVLVLAGVLAVLPLLALLPQGVRLVRTGRVDGLSGAAATLMLAACVGWAVYAAGSGHWGPFLGGLALLAAAGAGVVLLARRGGVSRSDVVVGLGGAAALSGVTAAGLVLGHGWVPLGVTLAGASLVVGVPQLLCSLRSASLAGLSPLSVSLLLVNAVLWTVYGLLVSDVPYVLYGVSSTVLTAPVLVRLVLWRRRLGTVSLPAQRSGSPAPAPLRAPVG